MAMVTHSITLWPMATGQPRTIGGKLFTEVTDLFDAETPISAFVLARLKRDAEKLQAADAVEASVVKSAIAAYEWKYDEADRWVKNSIALRQSAVNYQNAAVTMRALNDFKRARDYSLLAVDCAPQDTEVILKAVNSLILAGRFSDAYKLAVPVRLLSENLDGVCNEIEALHQTMAELDLTEERITSEMEVACDVATKNRVRISSVEHFVSNDPDGGNSIYIPLKFIGDIGIELKLEEELSSRLVQDERWNPLKLSIEFCYE